MKTTILFFIALIAASICSAQSTPCGFVPIGAGSSGVAAVDSGIIDTITPQCTPCAAQGCIGWQLSPDTSYHISFYTTSKDTFSIQLVTECHYLLWDTCVVLNVYNPIVYPPLFLGLVLPPSSQLIVCGDLGDTVIIEVKATPPLNFPAYTVPYLDLSTCSPPTATVEPIKAVRQYWEFDGVYWKPVDALKPNGLYKIRE
jgi:hypothetical protein